MCLTSVDLVFGGQPSYHQRFGAPPEMKMNSYTTAIAFDIPGRANEGIIRKGPGAAGPDEGPRDDKSK